MENKSVKYLVYDLETTGLNVEKSKICQIAAMCIVSRPEKEIVGGRRSMYCRPNLTEWEWNSNFVKKALEVNHTSKEMLADKVDEAVAIERFMKYVKDFNPDYIIGQNNIKFDNMLLINRLKQLNILDDYKFILDIPNLDTKIMSYKLISDIKNNKLETMAAYFGIEQLNAHDAINDVEVTYAVFKKLKERITGDLNDYAIPMNKTIYFAKDVSQVVSLNKSNPFAQISRR